ncbi:hypothetical protein CCOS865_05411 [Pseudomonas reidholzensis]|uniref:Uncharacterized protein n=1 Tax=Pseudomonas reidholzensis TaxID=1785162 RepID=A0A383S1A3_9PSED|nr:hypothetical protein [Pseudomonas reidholzensis]SYX93117.1 hypothetical protein CCOS865_05411 [Pseudomonas reidholzensis]
MDHHQHFASVTPRDLRPHDIWQGASGLSITSSCTSFAGFYDAFRGDSGTELVIGENNDLQIDFGHEVDCLMLEFYVVSDCDWLSEEDRLECEYLGLDATLFDPPAAYWLTLSGQLGTEFIRGVYASSPTRQLLLGPFRKLTISTTQAGTVHIPAFSWRLAVRH